MIWVVICTRCSGQDIIPYYFKDKKPESWEGMKFYCTGCGKDYTAQELLGLYVAS